MHEFITILNPQVSRYHRKNYILVVVVLVRS